MSTLVDAAGRVRFGLFAEPIQHVNHRDFVWTDPFGRPRGRLARHVGFKQFQFLGGLSEGLVFGCAVADLKWVATAFVYAYAPETRRLGAVSRQSLFARAARFDQHPESGTTTFAAGGTRIRMEAAPATRTRQLVVEDARIVIDAVFSEADPPLTPLCICTRAGVNGWVYARKTAGQRVTGTLRWDGRTHDLGALDVRGHHDWSAGYMRRQTFWNWGCLAGRTGDGRVVGLNVSCGVNETSFTENGFWLDGQLHKLDTVHFEYDRRDLLHPWRLTSFDGRLALDFQPENRHSERANVGLLATDFHQVVGRYRGRLDTAAGERVDVDGLLGYAEHHYTKW